MAAAATVAGALFSNPKYPRAYPAGPTFDYVSETVLSTSVDFAGDIYKLLPMRGSRIINELQVQNGDLDGGAGLDADIVLVDDNGTTILHNAGAGFQAARTGASGIVREPLRQEVVSKKNDAYIGIKTNTAAASPQSANVTLGVWHEGTGG